MLRLIPYFLPAVGFGGPVNHAYYLSRELGSMDVKNTVFTTNMYERSKPSIGSGEMEIDGIHVRFFPVIAGFRDYWITPTMLPEMMDEDFDIVHGHCYRNFQSDLAALTSTFRRRPFVLTTHGTVPPISSVDNVFKSLYDAATMRFVLRRVDKVIAVSRFEERQLRSYGFAEEKIEMIPHGVDVERFSPGDGEPFREKYGIEDRIILCVGRIHRRKGIQYLLRSFVSIKREEPETTLVVAGSDYGFKGRLIKLCRELDLLEDVVFTGPLRHRDDELIGAYRASDVVVLPSVYEVFGHVILEAGACGRPMVSSMTWGTSELIQHGVTGLLVKPGDVEGLSTAILRILVDHEWAERMGEDARNRIRSAYSWQAAAARHVSVYKKLLEGD